MAATMKKLASFASFRLAMTTLSAQPPSGGPPTPAEKPPDTVFLEEPIPAEVRDSIQGGTTTVIAGTADTERKGSEFLSSEF
jgi:hypothetical protein